MLSGSFIFASFYKQNPFYFQLEQDVLKQWRSQVIGIGRAPAVRLTIALTTLALTHTYTGQTLAGHVRRPGPAFATPLF